MKTVLISSPVDAGYKGRGEDQADDGEERQDHTGANVGQQQRLHVPVEALLHDGQTAVDVDLLIRKL